MVRKRGIPTIVIAMAICMLTGCYERVIRAEGDRARRVDVYEPNMKDERIPIIDDVGDLIFEPPSEMD